MKPYIPQDMHLEVAILALLHKDLYIPDYSANRTERTTLQVRHQAMARLRWRPMHLYAATLLGPEEAILLDSRMGR
jgi:hypothetical protein